MIEALTFLLLAQLAGEVIARTAGLEVPGPVVGLVHHFCGVCGCTTYSESPSWHDGKPDFDNPQVGVNARLFDDFDLAAVPVTVIDGKTLWSRHGQASRFRALFGPERWMVPLSFPSSCDEGVAGARRVPLK